MENRTFRLVLASNPPPVYCLAGGPTFQPRGCLAPALSSPAAAGDFSLVLQTPISSQHWLSHAAAIKIFSRLPFLLRQTTVHTFLLLSNTPSSRHESSSFTIAASTSEVNPTRPASRRSPSAHFCCFAGRDCFETHPRTCAYRGGTGQLSRPRSSNRQDAEDLVYGTSPPGRGRARSASGRESC